MRKTPTKTIDESSTGAEGALEAIWIKPARRVPMNNAESVEAIAGRGLVGNASQGSKRQVTILGRERWTEAGEALGLDIDPRVRRANLFVSGVDLSNSRGRILRIGDCRIEIHGETRPCRLMDEAHPGLQEALDARWGGGAYGRVLDDAMMHVGDPVSWIEPG